MTFQAEFPHIQGPNTACMNFFFLFAVDSALGHMSC